MIPRHLEAVLRAGLADSPVILLNGARRTGKSTLAEHLVSRGELDHYVTLDDLTVLAAARSDPEAFLDGLPRRVVIDEVQRVPDLLLAIKRCVDRARGRARPRFLLTGSANVMQLPRLSDTLAGRMEIHTLASFAQDELAQRRSKFLDKILRRKKPRYGPGPATGRQDLLRRLSLGGFPEALSRQTAKRRRAWFDAYTTTNLLREVRDLANIEGLIDLPRHARLLASRLSGLLNYADLARNSGLPQTTLKRYLGLLQAIFWLDLLPAWSANIGKRLVKSPKIQLLDTGLAAHLLGIERLTPDHPQAGPLLECFVYGELKRQASWSRHSLSLFHFRTHGGQEVDFVIEAGDGSIVGLEVKLGAQVGAHDFRGLKTLQEAAGARFRRGLVLYSGQETVSFGRELHAVPLPLLWA